jgi:hypothetical protein
LGQITKLQRKHPRFAEKNRQTHRKESVEERQAGEEGTAEGEGEKEGEPGVPPTHGRRVQKVLPSIHGPGGLR